MATINRRKVRLEINWEKDDPTNFTYRAVVWGYIADDAKIGGEEEIVATSETSTITRAQFRNLNGAQIESNAASLADAALQALGSGAGGHTIVDDDG